jgi:hypothetical protein
MAHLRLGIRNAECVPRYYSHIAVRGLWVSSQPRQLPSACHDSLRRVCFDSASTTSWQDLLGEDWSPRSAQKRNTHSTTTVWRNITPSWVEARVCRSPPGNHSNQVESSVHEYHIQAAFAAGRTLPPRGPAHRYLPDETRCLG